MSNEIVFINGKSRCGCVMAFSDGGGEYSDVHRIEEKKKTLAALGVSIS